MKTLVEWQHKSGRVEMWGGGVRFEYICSSLFHLAVPFDHVTVSTSRSLNRTCRSRIRFADKTSRLRPRHGVPKPVQATNPKCPDRADSEYPPYAQLVGRDVHSCTQPYQTSRI